MSTLFDRPRRAAAQLARRPVVAERKEGYSSRDNNHAPQQSGRETDQRHAAVRAARDLAQGQARYQARLSFRQDAELGAEGVGRDGRVVGYDADDEEVATPREAEAADVAVTAGGRGPDQGCLSLVQLVGMQQAEDGGNQGVCKYLDVGTRAFAARGAFGCNGEFCFYVFFDLCEIAQVSFPRLRHTDGEAGLGSSAYMSCPSSSQEEDHEQHKREVPRVDGMGDGRQKGGDDAPEGERLLRVGAVAEQGYRGHGDYGLHDER